MPTATTTWAIPLFDDDDFMEPDILLDALASGVDAAMTVLQKGGSPAVANSTARDALYPTHLQGDRAFRRDLGYEECYFTSPTTTIAGWYPTPGSAIFGEWARGVNDSTSSTTRINLMAATFANMPAGMYRITTNINISAPVGNGNIWIVVDGGDSLGVGIDFASTGRGLFSPGTIASHGGGTLSVGVDVQDTAAGAKTILGSSYIEVQYIGPRK